MWQTDGAVEGEATMYEDVLKDAEERMGKAIDALRNHLAGIRTGRASTGLIERLMVEYYGADTPLQQIANIAAPEARLLTVTPYDKGAFKAIEKAILSSDLGLNPNSDGNVIRLAIPALTEARRRDLVKIARAYGGGSARFPAQHPARCDEHAQRTGRRGRYLRR